MWPLLAEPALSVRGTPEAARITHSIVANCYTQSDFKRIRALGMRRQSIPEAPPRPLLGIGSHIPLVAPIRARNETRSPACMWVGPFANACDS